MIRKNSIWQDFKHKKIILKKTKKNPIILGFSCYFHDSSACILKNGKIIAAADEERFTRKKHDASFPINAIDFCLKEAQVKNVDAIVFYEDPDIKWQRIKKYLKTSKPKKETYENILFLWKNIKSKEKIQEKLTQVTGLTNAIVFLDHHLSHAASSYYVSGFDDAALVTVDGVGENHTTTIGYGQDEKIHLEKAVEFPNSIGLMYTAITTYLGFTANNDEYKVMGLAPYGIMDRDKNPYYKKFRKIIRLGANGEFRLNMKYFGHNKFDSTTYTGKLVDLFQLKPREKESAITIEHKNMAAALQIITEDAVMNILNYAYDLYKIPNLCLAGGVALNSVLNGKILERTPFKNIFIQPSAGDSGTVIGAVKYVQKVIDSDSKKEHFTHSSFGPKYSNTEILHYLKTHKIKYKKFKSEEDLLKKTAQLLNQKNVIGWFQGRMEWGPRALGNRSILASPLFNDMQDILNAKVKHREMFRPFAPVVCRDDANKYFECDNPIPEPTDYMLIVYPIKKDKQKKLPVVTHVDGSGRLQTIRKNQNKLYYKLIKEFGKLTGEPILVNTSFNVRGEPIVCSPHDAYKCVMGTEIDYLVIGKYLIRRKDNPKDMFNSDITE